MEVRWEDEDEKEEEGWLVEVEVEVVDEEGTIWVALWGTASPLIVTTDPPDPRSSVGPPPC